MGKRLLCLYPWLAIGGSDKFNIDMLSCLRARGWHITIVTTLPSPHPWREAFAAVSDEIIDLTRFPLREYAARLVQIAQAHEIDSVLVSHSTLGYHLLPYLRAHLPQLAYVDYCHIIEPRWRDGGYPRLSLDYRTQLDLQIVSSHALKTWMCARGGDAERIAVCTTNIDTDDWNPTRYDRRVLRDALGIGSDTPVVLYAGRLTQQKQPVLAARVMRVVAQRHPQVRFLVAGDGEYRAFLRGYIRHYQLHERVQLVGAVDNQRMRELLALSDIFFLPSENEGISLAIYEAMAMGVVPIGAAVGGQRELVTPAGGILVERTRHEREDYVAAFDHLLQQPAAMRQMAIAARQRVATHFRLDAMGAQIEALFAQAHTLHTTHPQPLVAAARALAAAQHARAVALQDEADINQTPSRPRTLWQRRHVWYRRVGANNVWWLVPLDDYLRTLAHTVRAQLVAMKQR